MSHLQGSVLPGFLMNLANPLGGELRRDSLRPSWTKWGFVLVASTTFTVVGVSRWQLRSLSDVPARLGGSTACSRFSAIPTESLCRGRDFTRLKPRSSRDRSPHATKGARPVSTPVARAVKEGRGRPEARVSWTHRSRSGCGPPQTYTGRGRSGRPVCRSVDTRIGDLCGSR